MKFYELLKLIPEYQEIHLIFSDLGVLATKDSMECLLNDVPLHAKVINIEAYDKKLKVWIEEE